ncbi:MAG: hypothetical protein GKR96_09440 [Gammaproteobacteria bacterium]|nr:hypothetical protein [Gammaproteobacteria bacterium]
MNLNLSQAVRNNEVVSASKPNKSHPTARPTALWICIYFPAISLDAASAKNPDLPILVVENIKDRQVVYTASTTALDQGVMSGMPLNAAYALCHKPEIILRSIAKETTLLKQYAELISHYTPTYSLSPPDTLLLEVSGSVKLFGGISAIYQSIKNTFNVSAVISLSPSPSASRLLAHTGHESVVLHPHQLKKSLSTIKIAHIDLHKKMKMQLSKCGIHTLGDLWRLPRPDLGRRFGIDLVRMMDKLLAAEPDPQTATVPKLTFSKEIILSTHNNDKAILCLAAEELLTMAQHFLKQHSSMMEKVSFKLRHEKYNDHERSSTEVLARSQKASHDPRRFLPQFTEQLAQLNLAQPVSSICLTIDEVIPSSRFSDDLFNPEKKDNQDWGHLMDVIKSRLGNHLLYGIQPFPDHRPELAWKQRTVQSGSTKQPCLGKAKEIKQVGQKRPLWLVRKPGKIEVKIFQPASIHDVERIQSGWWDQQNIRRDYQIIHLDNGAKVWAYLDLSSRDFFNGVRGWSRTKNTVRQKQSHWYLHGLFG